MSNQEKYGTIQKVVVKSYYQYSFVLTIETDKYLLEIETGGDKDAIYRYNPLSKDWNEHASVEIFNIDIIKHFDFDSDSDSDSDFDFDSSIEEIRKTYLKEEGGYLTRYHSRKFCSDDCKGWNGFDKRCDCGSRKVYWSEALCYEAD
jgi:hypothetical protein